MFNKVKDDYYYYNEDDSLMEKNVKQGSVGFIKKIVIQK